MKSISLDFNKDYLHSIKDKQYKRMSAIIFNTTEASKYEILNEFKEKLSKRKSKLDMKEKFK